MKHYKNFDLTKFNSYNLKATCANAYFPEDEPDIEFLFKEKLRNKKIILGNGNNIIFSKEWYDEDFIIFNSTYNKIFIKDNILEIESGATLLNSSMLALKQSLTGLEIFYDIPGSVGGAIFMNAGAGSEQIGDILMKVRFYVPNKNEFQEVQKEFLGFNYRDSFFQKNEHFIITKAWLELKPGNDKEISYKMKKTKDDRWLKQPREYPNAGSVFKRPKNYFVGKILDELGLKGFSIGGAKISEKHAGFIINYNHAKGEDILKIIQMVTEKVYEKYSIDLELEQRIV
jgi:UDP-N-acetylmuramate dehydrogenase